MKGSLLSTLLCILLTSRLVFSNYDIKIYNIQQCDSNHYYPITVSNVHLEVKDGYAYVSGSLTSDVNITSPVQAHLMIKRYIKDLNIWIRMPDLNYDDLCSYGLPVNKTCPEHFEKDKVPCRCPISEGFYELHPENKLQLFKIPDKMFFRLPNAPKNNDRGNIIAAPTGTYWFQTTFTEKGSLLSCYTFYLDYVNELSNEIETLDPIVTLIL